MIDTAKRLVVAGLLALIPAAAIADDDVMVFGGDTYASGQTTNLDSDSPRSAFVSGFSAAIDGSVAKDAHIAGGHVSVDGPVNGDLYAAGFWVSVGGTVGGDLSASGFSVALEKNAAVTGNTRIAARSIDVNAPVNGSFLAVAQKVTINAPITGDVMIGITELSFGPNAKIDGILTYVGPKSIEIPENVIAPDRVIHRKFAGAALSTLAQLTAAGVAIHEIKENGVVKTTAEAVIAKQAVTAATEHVINGRDSETDTGFWALLGGFLITVIAYLLIAAIFLAYVPKRTEAVRARLAAKPLSSLCLGFLFLSMLVGAVPVAAITIVGIVFIPFILLAIVVACVLAYLVAAYTFAWAILSRIKPILPSLTNKLLATAAGLVLLSLTHYLWFFGWIINLAVVLLGLGAMAAVLARVMLSAREHDGDDTPTAVAAAETTEPVPQAQDDGEGPETRF